MGNFPARTTRVLAGLLMLLAALSSCQLFGGATQVRFDNLTSFTFTSITFASVQVSSPLAAGQTSSYFPVTPGQDILSAQIQGSTWTNNIQFSIIAGHSYTITFATDPITTLLVVTITTDS